MKSPKLKIGLALFSITVGFLVGGNIVRAQEATPGGIIETGDNPVVKAVREFVEGQSDPSQNQKRGFFGQITDLFNQTIVIQTDQGKKTAKIDEETEIVDQKKSKVKFEDLEIGGYLIAMGYAETPEEVLAKRIVITPKPAETNRLAVMGKLIESTGKTFTLKLLDGSDWEITPDKNTVFVQKNKDLEIELGEINKDALLIVAGVSEKENEIEATHVYVLINPQPSSASTEESTSAATL